MKSFRQFLEAFASNMNWNVLPTARQAPPPSMPVSSTAEVTYHKDISLPKDFDKPKAGMLLRYGTHAKDRSAEKGVPLPVRLPAEFDIIEVTMIKYRVIKWVIRFPTETDYDVVMVVQPDGFVRTTWPNRWDDKHGTLDKSKYGRAA